MEGAIIVVAGVALGLFGLFLLMLRRLLYVCSPNEVLIFSGSRRRVGGRLVGYKIITGGRKVRIPLLERVDRLDLTNMVIDLTASNAYSKGGIPLTVQGVANVKIASHEPVLNNAIERFLGKPRTAVAEIAKATLEGSLRGILATLTPEQVNDDKILFAERVVQEVGGDMTDLGLVVDTLKIQNVQDDAQYLNSIGRQKNAELISSARIAEAKAKADAGVRTAENREREQTAEIMAQMEIVKADAGKRLLDAQTRREAVVAEELAAVAALVAKATADLDVQKARIEQVTRQLQADVIAPAKANCEAAEAKAKSDVQEIIQDGEARAQALRNLAASWKEAGDNAKDIFLLQKLEGVIGKITDTISDTPIEQVTLIDTRQGGNGPVSWIPALEQVKELFGVDVVEKLKALGEKQPVAATPSLPPTPPSDPETPAEPESNWKTWDLSGPKDRR